MYAKVVNDFILYDGSQLTSLWAYRRFNLQGDSIVAFRGPCRVTVEKMVDLEDVLKGAHISSEDMLHFIVEHFDMDLEKTITRQRLLMSIIGEIVSKKGAVLVRSGDDLYWEGRKLSVSIATLTPVSTMIHAGINISSRNTPVPAVGLFDLGYAEEEILPVAASITEAYVREIEGIKKARCKVRGVN